MAAFLDAVRFNPTAGALTDWTFSAAVTGYQSPAAANVVNGKAYKYRAESADLSQWELGEGTYNTSTGVLTRATILFSTNANAKVNFSTTPQVAIVGLAEDVPSLTENNTFSGANTFSGGTSVTNATASTSTTTGALKVTGGIGAQGDVHANSFEPHVAPGSGWGIDFSAGGTVSVPGSGHLALAIGSGLIMLTDASVTGQTGLYLNGGSATASAVLVAGGSAFVAPTTTPASGKYSIGFDGTNWNIYNGNASAINFFVGLIRNRNTD